MSKSRASVQFNKVDESTGSFVVSPLPAGMGPTIGNSLRRVLLSSLQGAAITSLVIEGVEHEFSPIDNAVEDVLDVIFNLKALVFKLHDSESADLTLSFNGKGALTAKEFKTTSNIEIINSDQHIIEFTSTAKFSLTIHVENGVGYIPSESHTRENTSTNTIFIDSSFSPIIRVNPTVEKTRVGKSLDFDELTLDVLTDGSLDVEDAIKEASTRLVELFMLFADMKQPPEIVKEEDVVEDDTQQNVGLSLTIDDLELSARSLNCLKKAGIDTVATLISKDMSDLIQIKNFGKKSADEINEKLAQYNLSLKQLEATE